MEDFVLEVAVIRTLVRRPADHRIRAAVDAFVVLLPADLDADGVGHR